MKTNKYSRWSRKLECNILRVYNAASSEEREVGMLWYAVAHDHASAMALRHSVSISVACGTIAAISPGLEWGRNLLEAESLLRAFQAGKRGHQLPTVGIYGKRNMAKAIAILQGEAPLSVIPETSPKVRAFYETILSPTDSQAVTVDGHAYCLAYGIRDGRWKQSFKPNKYAYVAWHYRHLAARLGLLPSQLQAVCWVTWRRIVNEEVPF